MHSMRDIQIIVAVDARGGFGKDGQIPWLDQPFAKADLAHFKKTTSGSTCIMGRKTYEEIVEVAKKAGRKTPLPGRDVIVLTSATDFEVIGGTACTSLRQAVEQADPNKPVYAIGGGRVFSEALSFAQTIYMSVVNGDYDCTDKFNVAFVANHFTPQLLGKHEDDVAFIKYTRR